VIGVTHTDFGEAVVAVVVRYLERRIPQMNKSVTITVHEDGTVMAHFSSALLSEAITAPERVRLDFRNFAWLGNVSEDVRVCYLRSASGIRDWRDMLARNEVVFGATAQGNAGNVDTAMLRNLFGVKLKQVSGYAGSAEKRLAVEKGEIDGDCGGWTSIPQDWLRGPRINVMLRLSPTLLPGIDGNVPFGGDLLRVGQVIACLGLVGIRNRRGADFEIAFGRFELFGNRHLLRLRGGQRILRQQLEIPDHRVGRIRSFGQVHFFAHVDS
jgi:hypothetical protein